MGWPKLQPGEWVRADVTSPPAVLGFPLLELIAYTGLIWMGIGYLDNPYGVFSDPLLRQGLVLLWAVLVIWRFVLPLAKARRRRFVVTDRRIIARSDSLRPRVDSIPLRDVHSVRRVKGGLSVAVFGFDRPLYFPNVGKVRKTETAVKHALEDARYLPRPAAPVQRRYPRAYR